MIIGTKKYSSLEGRNNKNLFKSKENKKTSKRLEILSLYPIILNVRGTFYIFISIY